jgi:hypothetical protein
MYRLHLTRNLRSLAFVFIATAVLAGLGVIGWANHTGMPQAWRDAIGREVAKQGAHIKIGSLRYIPFKGVIANDLQVFSEAEHLREISRLEQVILVFDKTKLARGLIHLTKIELSDARLVLPVDPKDPDSEILNVTDANGTILMPGGRRLEVRNARGNIAGILVTLDARVIGYQQGGEHKTDETDTGKRRELLANVIKELEKWHFDKNDPPSIRISAEGTVNNYSSFKAKLALRVKNMEKNGHVLDEISAEADMNGDILTVTSLRATDPRGMLEGRIDYDLRGRGGRFDIASSLELPQLIKAWAGLPSLQDVVIGGKQSVEAAGEFQLDENKQAQIRVTGQARCESVMLRGITFDEVAGAFSWRDGDLFLRDLRLVRPDGEATGKALFEWPLVRLALKTTLPVPVYRPFFVNHPLERVLADFSENRGAKVEVELEGSFDTDKPDAWAFTGSGAVQNLSYRGVPAKAANCKFSLNHHELDFYEGTAVFDYSRYALRAAFGGANEGSAKVGRIRYVRETHLVEVENVNGAIWAAPVVRLFAPKIADSLEQYRFHQPPLMKASGAVDVTSEGRTTMDISFSSKAPAEYQFLGENLSLDSPRGQVAIRGQRVIVSDLEFKAFEGPVSARFEHSNGMLSGDVSWTKLSLPELASSYDFQIKGGGTTTGRIDFSLQDGKVETMAGNGLLALEQTELFSVPMFGPLTPLIGGVLNDDTAGTQLAKNAFCTFGIQNGLLTTNDFQTSTTSLNFAGDGQVDLRDRSIDLTLRMNARGLLRFITLPLRPFSGLFQFRGTGPLKNPEWKSMKFTAAPEAQQELLLTPPRARVVMEE